ncbi:LuxR C-terminal-related transcriptional regulator [Lipingzhangella sp. LS1_29]|uniref:LuxR C-terminal-related transcriptional regulator n=1 Tax=Lipingzhangella rawalii TaxID=2055835 RepID=A0ABU2HCD1_9ACTN|nr:LuxR C-terminal-related transcriptional regulator [Lipingzhangella rawalii]MDS1272490.1 LuxR C-terminal-related transcriptional regulator [Lipingzhangella rawalii]
MAVHTTPARTNLPLEQSSFVGRERDLSDLLQLLRTSRVVTLCGVGGIGKTRLALRVAAQAASSYPDGVWLTELADASAREHIVSRIAASVGVAEEGSRPLDETLTDTIRPRRLLLVLDNSEHVIGAVASLVTDLLSSCPDVSVLITSREPARISGEAVWRVPPLAIPLSDSTVSGCTLGSDSAPDGTDSEAVRLFLDRARAVSQDFTPTPEQLRIVAGICRVLDGIPLGIELAAARVRVLSLTQIAERLDDRFRLLRATDRNAPERQQTLRAVIDWSHTLLPEAEQVLLRRLSVFAGWDLELAELVCADPEYTVDAADSAGPAGSRGPRIAKEDILDLLSSLVDRSLVVLSGEHHGRARYRMLDTIRAYAADLLRNSGEEPLFRDRVRAHMLALAEQVAHNTVLGTGITWPERFQIWHRVVAEYDNLRAAITWSYEQGDISHGLRFCVALRPYWMATGQFAEGALWTDRFLEAATAAAVDPWLVGQAMVRRAELAFDQQDHSLAERLGEEGLHRCRAAGDTQSVALALNILAMVDMRAHAHIRAHERLQEVIRLTGGGRDPWNEGIAHGTEGALAAQLGDLATAKDYFETALRILRGIDHRWGVGRTLIGQGMVAEAEGDLGAADRSFREALELQRSIGAPPELARCLAGIGRVAARRGDTHQAHDYLSESLRLSYSTGQRMGVARGLSALAELAHQQGRHGVAHRLAGAGAAIRERSGLPRSRRIWLNEADTRDPRAHRHWADGRSMSIDDAVALALRFGREPGSPSDAGTYTDTDQSVTEEASTGAEPQLLTARELEIAALIAEGLSNRGIAERLFISPATVARHVANIHTKLDFHSRTQIATWITHQHRD